MRFAAAVAGCVFAGWLCPAASAETAVLSERPGPPGVVFTDDPPIVDPRPMPAESFTRTPDDRAIALHFTTGTPACYGVTATVEETPQTVTVALRGGTLAEAVNRACIMIAVSGTLDVPLASALGARQVVSVY